MIDLGCLLSFVTVVDSGALVRLPSVSVSRSQA